jgi:hypothetical protein
LLGFSGPGASPSPSTTPAEHGPRTEIGVVTLRASGIDAQALSTDLALRMPGTPIVEHGQPMQHETGLVVFADVARATDETGNAVHYSLTLVVSDGRAYDRVVTPEPRSRALEQRRLVVRNLVNLLHAVEAGAVSPDRDGVPIPLAPPPPNASPTSHDEPTAPQPVRIECPTPPERAEPRIELGPRVSLAAILGVGAPADTDRFAAFGGEFGLGLRLRNGAAFVTDLRVAGRSHERGFRLLRLRVAVGGGYAWRPHDAVELEALALVHVEPWLVFRSDLPTPLGRQPPTFGGSIRLAPGYRWRTVSGRASGRVGTWLEVGGSFVPDPGVGVAKVSIQTDEGSVPMFRVGGAEIVGGIQTVVWFAVR